MPSQNPKQQPEPEESSDESSSSEEIEHEEDDDEEEEDDDEGETQGTPPSVATNQFERKKRDTKQQSSDKESDESGSETEPESSQAKPEPAGIRQTSAAVKSPPASHSVKPISSKPMDDAPQSKKAKTSGAKRPLELTKEKEKEKEKEKQKKKTKVTEVPDDSPHQEDEHGDDQKKLFQRIWTDENEIGLLNGFLDFTKKGGDVGGDKAVFVEFLKKHVHGDFNKTQLMDKIRRLKKKYETLVNKGKEPGFKTDHERTAYEISKKIWGKKVEGNGNTAINRDLIEAKGGSKRSSAVRDSEAKNSKGGGGFSVTTSVNGKNQAKKPQKLKEIAALEDHQNSEDVEAPGREVQNGSSLYPCLKDSLHFCADSASGFGRGLQPIVRSPVLKLLEKGVDLLDSSTAEELEKNWNDLQMQELEVYSKRIKLVEKQNQLIIEALKSSNA